jgi:hypothetical protein
MSTAELTERTEEEMVILLGQESTNTYTIEHLQLETAEAAAPASEIEGYLKVEAQRRGVPLRVVRHEEDIDDLRAAAEARQSGVRIPFDEVCKELGLD